MLRMFSRLLLLVIILFTIRQADAQNFLLHLDSGRLIWRIEPDVWSKHSKWHYDIRGNLIYPADYRADAGYYNCSGSAIDLWIYDWKHPWTGWGGPGDYAAFPINQDFARGVDYEGGPERVEQMKYMKYPYPNVTVNGEFAGRPADEPENVTIDPDLPCDMMGWNKTYSIIGLTAYVKTYTWSHPDYQDIVIAHYKVVNDGHWRKSFREYQEAFMNPNTWDNNGSGVIIRWFRRFEPGGLSWDPERGQNEWANWNFWGYGIVDSVQDPSVRLMYGWDTDNPNTPEEDEGEWDARTQRFLYPQYLGYGFLHVDAAPGDTTNDPSRIYHWGMQTWPTLGASNKFMFRVFLEANKYGVNPADIMPNKTVLRDPDTGGLGIYDDKYPHGTKDVKLEWYTGPWSLTLGDTINFWVCYVAGGLDAHDAVTEGEKYGRYYEKGSNGGKGWPDSIIAAKNKMLRQKGVNDVIENYKKAIAIYKNGMRLPVPDNLEPPAWFDIKAGPGRVDLSWASVPGAVGYKIYRTKHGEGEKDKALFYLIDSTDAVTTTYSDTSARRNFSYFYYVTAVDENGVESSHYLTRSRKPVTPYAASGETLADIRVVPNPFVYDPLGQRNYGKDKDRITFAGLPGPCKITIYTLTGDIVDELENRENSGSFVWDTKTRYNQYLASGIYIYHVQSTDGKGSATGKFIVIR